MNYDVVYRLMHELDRKFCEKHCPTKGEGRCCPRESCEEVLKTCPPETKKLFNPSKGFLGENGCLVPPEQRKYCTTFICIAFANSKACKGHMALIGLLGMRERFEFRGRINRTLEMMENMRERGYGVLDVIRYLQGKN